MILLNIVYSIMSLIVLTYQFISYKNMKADKGVKFWAVIALTLAICMAALVLLAGHDGLRIYGFCACVMTSIATIRELRAKSEMTVAQFFGGLLINFLFWPQSLAVVIFHVVNRVALEESRKLEDGPGSGPKSDPEIEEE